MVYDLQHGYQTTVIDSKVSYSLFYQIVVDPNRRWSYHTCMHHIATILFLFILCRILYWSDIGSNPPRINNASMDGSSVGTVVSLHKTDDNYTNAFLFTIDYSQQMLYWWNDSNSCNYTSYIETSNINGSGRRIIYNASTMDGRCTNNGYPQAIDFFRGAIYTYPGHRRDIFKAVVENAPKIVTYNNINWYMCNSTYYAVMKVISPERQLQGM